VIFATSISNSRPRNPTSFSSTLLILHKQLLDSLQGVNLVALDLLKPGDRVASAHFAWPDAGQRQFNRHFGGPSHAEASRAYC
jgi:hypothetical protein